MDEYKQILKDEEVTGKDVASWLGVSYSSYRGSTMKSLKKYPKWVRAFVIGYKLGRGILKKKP